MEEKKNKVRRNEMIHCENCGEDYASTYKRCPFCDEVNHSGGRRADRTAPCTGWPPWSP